MNKRIIKLNIDGSLPENPIYYTDIVKELPELETIRVGLGEEAIRGFKVDGGMTVIGGFYQVDMETNSVIDKIEKEIKKMEAKKEKLLRNFHRFKLHTNKS